MNRLHFISTIVFIIALSTYGYIQWQKSNEESIVPQTDVNNPDYIATSLSSNKYDSNGKLSHTIYADEMEHYATQNKTIFTSPKFAFYPDDDKPSWHISANDGELNNDKILTLTSRVRLISSDKDSFISEIQGNSLTMDLRDKIITSEQTIMLKGKDFTMYGSGLRVDINTTEMTISEHVQTIYKKHAS